MGRHGIGAYHSQTAAVRVPETHGVGGELALTAPSGGLAVHAVIAGTRGIGVLLSPAATLEMATCPRCRGHLTEHHRCPRRPGRLAAEMAASAVAGAILALLVVALVDPQGRLTSIDAWAAGLGAAGGAWLVGLLRR
jgi:hypothetical protein